MIDPEFILSQSELDALSSKFHIEGVTRQLRKYLEADFGIDVFGLSNSDYTIADESGNITNGDLRPNIMVMSGPEIRINDFESRKPIEKLVGEFDNGNKKKVYFTSYRYIDLAYTLTAIRESHFDLLDDIETWLLWFHRRHLEKAPSFTTPEPDVKVKKFSDWMEFEGQLYQVKEDLVMSPENLVNFSNWDIARGMLVVKRVVLVNPNVYEVVGAVLPREDQPDVPQVEIKLKVNKNC